MFVVTAFTNFSSARKRFGGTHEDEMTVLYETKSFYVTKPNTNPNPNTDPNPN